MAKDFLQYRNHYVRDWETSETVRIMSYAARGIYQALLDAQWEKGSIPADPETCARLLRCEPEEWAQFAPFFDECFPLTACGSRRANERLAGDRDDALQLVEKNRAAGKASAEKRRLNLNEAGDEHPFNDRSTPVERTLNPTTTTTTTTTTNNSSLSETDFEDEERQPSGLPSKGTQWYEEEGYENRELAEVAMKVASTRIRSKENRFPYRGITERDAERILEALKPCPNERELGLLWEAWNDHHSDRTKPPYKVTGVARALCEWASRRAGQWATQARLQGYQQERQSEGYSLPKFRPGGNK